MRIQNCRIMAGMGKALPECDPSLSQLSWSDELGVCSGTGAPQRGGLYLWVKPAAFVPVKLNVLRGRESCRSRKREQGKATLDIPGECLWPGTQVGFLAG